VPPSYAGNELASALKSIVGDKYFLNEPTAMIPYVRDSGIFEGVPPGFVVRPSSVDEVVEVIKVANKYKVPIRIRGGDLATPQRSCLKNVGEYCSIRHV
jgi:hypothetical protein